MSGIDALLASLPPWTLVGGKGGVGKTTCAAALATRSARDGVPTLLVSTDPAGALGDVLGVPLSAEPKPVSSLPSLSAFQLDATAARTAFLRQYGDVLATILDRGTYLGREDIEGLVDAALPGVDETMALLALAEIPDSGSWSRVVIDTAPTGHTLRLLALPDSFTAVVELLDTMQAKHRFMVSALTHRYRPDAADAFICDLRKRLTRFRELVTDRGRTGVVLVSRPETVVTAETSRYATALEKLGIGVRALVINAVASRDGAADLEAATALKDGVPRASVYRVPALGVLPAGPIGVERWTNGVRRADSRASRAKRIADTAPTSTLASRPVAAAALLTLPPVLIVGGKGGVGKTSVSCALALQLARCGHRVLLASTDPAPSIADALAEPIDDTERVVRDACGLVARQIDATAAFARWRTDYAARVDAAFDGLLGPGLDAAHDRVIARQLLSLAPPGIDELYALIWLGDALAEGRFAHIIIDPAPTGHLIRLLEMPALALEWSHRLLRLMLKYRELAGGGETSAELLAFAQRTRAVGELLHDPSRAGVLIVALDEPVVRLETERVVGRIRQLGDHVPAIIWNRVDRPPAPLPLSPPIGQFAAAELSPPPVGASALMGWLDEWRVLELDG